MLTADDLTPNNSKQSATNCLFLGIAAIPGYSNVCLLPDRIEFPETGTIRKSSKACHDHQRNMILRKVAIKFGDSIWILERCFELMLPNSCRWGLGVESCNRKFWWLADLLLEALALSFGWWALWQLSTEFVWSWSVLFDSTLVTRVNSGASKLAAFAGLSFFSFRLPFRTSNVKSQELQCASKLHTSHRCCRGQAWRK